MKWDRLKYGMRRWAVIAVLWVLGASTLYIAFADPGTEYATGYSEDGFRQLGVGDSKEHVVAVLGGPLLIVGDLFIYRYLKLHVNFEVNSRTGEAKVRHYFGEGDVPTEFLDLYTLQQLTSTLGQPDLIVGAQGGQSQNPSELSYVYSREGRGWDHWNYRVVYVHKETGLVTDKLSVRLSEF